MAKTAPISETKITAAGELPRNLQIGCEVCGQRVRGYHPDARGRRVRPSVQQPALARLRELHAAECPGPRNCLVCEQPVKLIRSFGQSELHFTEDPDDQQRVVHDACAIRFTFQYHTALTTGRGAWYTLPAPPSG